MLCSPTVQPNSADQQVVDQQIKDTLLIFKNGTFYNTYKDDAIILNYLFGYKILKDDKAGFPETSFTKVINELENRKINYQVITKDTNPIIKKFGNLNTYLKILNKSLEFINIKDRVNRIQEKLNNVTSVETLEKILKVLENELQWRKI